ncbi:glutamate/tyrosine decarboxylase-like PLP-dependent enzyme [Maribacter vaceletii]|uniref:Glutamate/tyrosine decarboxylase-like PLP-dependent enzyme n=1 Tax=Maribacter vaceletii TaxID=1206816 RepID=A0A495EE33_9FLAO|nr:aminotransferase class V-fold PLP-dependent enzyme [Maribacter vaceletii]RKR15154.1 glutamate/tyrosine decarboxylase-like PLP-dependent enzyme [Maribacter vaceletii]
MEKKGTIQDKMYADIQDVSIYQTAQKKGYEYLTNVFDRNVYPTKKALEDLANFDEDMPTATSEANTILEHLNTYGSPATVANMGGRYFGFVCGSSVPIGLAAKNLATFWDQSPTMNVLSPIGSKLETVVENWLKQLFNLPESTVAGFVSGTSMATFCGLAAARYRLLSNQGWNINDQGFSNAPKIRVITGKHAHSTVLKAISLLGFGKNNIEWVDVDNQGRIIPDRIPEMDNATLLILQAGNVNSGSFDDFEQICKKANKVGAWVHIDGAFGMWAGAVNQLKHLTKGAEKANSWAVDGHKTLNTPYDNGIVLCEDKEALMSALHMSGSYIVTSKERDGTFYTPEMSRRARIVELWAILKYLGKNGIDEMILEMHKRALQFSKELSNINGFTVLNDVVFNQVMVSCETDDLTDKTLARIQELRKCWVGGSTWKGKKVIRISVCSWATTKEDVDISVSSFKKALEEINIELSS